MAPLAGDNWSSSHTGKLPCEVAVVAALTHIRVRPWLEQMMARATRVDPHAGPYEMQGALVFHANDPLFPQFRRRRSRSGDRGQTTDCSAWSAPCKAIVARTAD